MFRTGLEVNRVRPAKRRMQLNSENMIPQLARRGASGTQRNSLIFALMFAIAMARPSQAQDASEGGSSWDWLDSLRLDSVLVLPSVYRGVGSVPTDACAEDCPDSSNQGVGESPRAVAGTADDAVNANAGTADNPADDSAGPDASVVDGSDLQEQQAAAGGDPQSADSLDSSLGSIQDYEAQQAAAAELGNYGIVQAPSVIIVAPVGRYYARRTFFSSAGIRSHGQGGAATVNCPSSASENCWRRSQRILRRFSRRRLFTYIRNPRGIRAYVRSPRRIRA